MEHALQASMFTHSTLTEGEWVQIAHEGTMHDVKVLALQPEAAVSVIGNSLTAQDCCLGPEILMYRSRELQHVCGDCQRSADCNEAVVVGIRIVFNRLQ